MLIVSSVIIFYFIGALGAWRPDIDINRVRLLSKEPHRNSRISSRPGNIIHARRSIFHNYNDYDNHRGRIIEPPSPSHFLPDTLSTADSKTIKLHQPREDPRVFYLSNAFAKKSNHRNLSNDHFSSIYPGDDVVRPISNLQYRRNTHMPYSARLQERQLNYIPEVFNRDDICAKCPPDVTLIAKPGSDRVKVPHPRIRSCAGLQVPRGVRYEHMHGPKFGSLLTEGSHSIVGRITYWGEIIRHCVMEVRVLTQTCTLPRYLVAHCGDLNKTCSFACRDSKSDLYGAARLTCGDDKRWLGNLPVCRVRNWCEPISPPAHGRVSCKGATIKGGLAEGSTCRVRCARDWTQRANRVTMCRKGSWTSPLSCVYRYYP